MVQYCHTQMTDVAGGMLHGDCTQRWSLCVPSLFMLVLHNTSCLYYILYYTTCYVFTTSTLVGRRNFLSVGMGSCKSAYPPPQKKIIKKIIIIEVVQSLPECPYFWQLEAGLTPPLPCGMSTVTTARDRHMANWCMSLSILLYVHIYIAWKKGGNYIT